jgi:hypothetical protein
MDQKACLQLSCQVITSMEAAIISPDDNPGDDNRPSAAPVVETVDGAHEMLSTYYCHHNDAIEMFLTTHACGCHGSDVCTCPHPLPTYLLELPFQCSCCCFQACKEIPSGLAAKVLLHQHLGCQTDVPLEELHEHTDGVPISAIDCPPVCGHCWMDDCLSPPSAMCAPAREMGSTNEQEYLEPGQQYVI